LSVGQFTGVEHVDITGSGSNSLAVVQADVLNNLAGTSERLSIVAGEDDQVPLSNGWKVTGTTVQDGRFYRVLTHEAATVHLAGPHDWQNPVEPHDVTVDSAVVPFDVLAIVNQLNDPIYLLDNRQLVAAATVDPFPMRFYDVDGNGFTTPLDALGIVNFMNDLIAGEGENVAAEPLAERSSQFSFTAALLIPDRVLGQVNGNGGMPRTIATTDDAPLPRWQREAALEPYLIAQSRVARRLTGESNAAALTPSEQNHLVDELSRDEWILPDELERLIDELVG
jgi:hypothetical protein